MICIIASAGPFAISQALPQLFRQFDRPVLPTHRSAIIGAIGALVMAASTVYAKPESGRRFDDEKSLESCRGSLMDVMREGLRTDDLRNWGILGSVAMIEIPGFLSASEAEDLIKGMNEILIHDDDEQNRCVEVYHMRNSYLSSFRSAVIKGLTAVSARNAQVIDAVTLPLLFHNLPDQAPSISAVKERESYRRILNSLSQLCIQPSLFETLVIRVTTKLELLSQAPTQSTTDVDMSTGDGADVDDRECNVAFAYDLLQCLATVLDSKIKEKHVDVVKYFDKIIPRLYSLVISAAGLKNSGRAPFFQDRRLLSIIGRITETLMWELSAE
jgi:DNA repair/transcription protein MET18/MMS19